MIVKIELIVLSIIAILSFVTGVVINLIDIYHGKEIDKNNDHFVEDEYQDNVIKKINEDTNDDGETIVDINIPRTFKKDEKHEDDEPTIIEVLTYDEDK